MPINGRWSGDWRVPPAKENKCKAAGREEPGGLQNQKFSISLGASIDQCRLGCLGNSSSRVLRERPARNLGAMDQRLPGDKCWNLLWERKRQLEVGVPEKPLFVQQASAGSLLCSRHRAMGQKKQGSHIDRDLQSMGMGSWKWGLDIYSCNYTFQTARTKRFPRARGPTQFVEVILGVIFKGKVGDGDGVMGGYHGKSEWCDQAWRQGDKIHLSEERRGPIWQDGQKCEKNV